MKKQLKKIFQLLTRSERTRFGRLIVLDIFLSLLDIAFLAILLYVIQFYTQPATNGKQIFLNGLLNKYPLILITSFFLSFGLKNWLAYLINQSQFRFRAKVASRLSKENMQRFLEGNFEDFIAVDSAVHFRRISQQPIEYCHYILGGLQQMISQLILICFTITAVILFSPLLFILLLVILAPPVILTGILMKRKLTRLRASARSINEMSIQYLNEGLKGYIESNLYQSRDFLTDRYHKYQSKHNLFLSDQQSIQFLPSRLIEIFAILGLLILILLNSLTAGNFTIPILTIGAFMAGAYKIIPGIVKIMNSAGQIRAFSFIIADLSFKSTTIEELKKSPIENINSLTFQGVNFSYQEKQILKDLTFSLKSGELVGISGISGVGKTTAINLMLGFIIPDQGAILVNEAVANETQLKAFRDRIAYVKQESFFIHDTIVKNITLNENYDEHRLWKVIQETGLDFHLQSLPLGAGTLLTENAKNISGGQRQLICLARALYKDTDLLILDEPFNELDHEREYKLMDHLNVLVSKGKMILIVTHHKKMLQHCSKIIMLDTI